MSHVFYCVIYFIKIIYATDTIRHMTSTNKSSTFKKFTPIYAAMLFLVFHGFLVAYINSSYLNQFISENAIGTMYTVGSALTVLVFLFISRVLQKVGNFYLTLGLLIADFFAVLGMSFASSLETAVPLFVVHLITVPLIVFNLDIFLESLIGNDESATGSRRGLFLTMSSLVVAISPVISSFLIGYGDGSFTLPYFISALSLLPIH